jgi:hypothetical protein
VAAAENRRWTLSSKADPLMSLPEKSRQIRDPGRARQGRQGVVYKGFDRAISRGVAIKAISKSTLGPARSIM